VERLLSSWVVLCNHPNPFVAEGSAPENLFPDVPNGDPEKLQGWIKCDIVIVAGSYRK
jgi:hypothetical protein